MPYTQDSRICRIESPLGKDALLLRRMSAVEEISGLFRFQLDLVSNLGDIEFEKIVGDGLTLGMLLPGGEERYFHGIVSRFSQGGQYVGGEGEERGLVCYEATVVPWLWYLTRSANSRVFEKKSVKDVLKEVFDKLGFTDYEFFKLANQYDPIDYCVQYAETDFNFVSRLMEQWGLAYTFRHENGKHTLVIFDTSASLPDCPMESTLIYATQSGQTRRGNEVEEWSVSQEMPPGRYALKDYNFEKPSTDLHVPTLTQLSMGSNAAYEIYEYPGEYGTEDAGKQFVKLRMEAEETASHEVQGRASWGALSAGTHVKLEGHYRESFNGKRYLLTRVHHSVTQGVGRESSSSSYENSFACIPERIPYRPVRRTPKPAIHGIQTALVVGPSGEEIHCDKYGRIRIQFYWDREGKADGTNVCWARVAQVSAGKKWGALFTPRIGQEVVVTFLEGDPDRPLVTGVVYNAEQMPPYELDANKTKSGFKTRSSKASGGALGNELRFEDKKGEEQIFIYAERNQDVRVKSEMMEWIGGKRHLIVKKDQLEKIEGGKHLQVLGDQEESVKGDFALKVDGNRDAHIALASRDKVDGEHHLVVGASAFRHVKAAEHVKVDKEWNQEAGETISIKGGKDIHQKAGANHTVDAGKSIHIKAGMTCVIEAGTQVSLKVGSNFIDINSSGIFIKGTQIMLNAGGSAGSGAGCSPTAPSEASAAEDAEPQEPAAADTSKPGEMVQPQATAWPSSPGRYGAQAVALRQAAESGAPFSEKCEEEKCEETRNHIGGEEREDARGGDRSGPDDVGPVTR